MGWATTAFDVAPGVLGQVEKQGVRAVGIGEPIELVLITSAASTS